MENDIGIINANDENQIRLADLLKLLLRGKICMLFFICVFKVIMQGMHN